MREVRESGAKDVGEALANIAGLWKIRKGAIANDVVLRGFQSGNLNVLVDGARIYGACPGHMDPAAFHVDFAEVDRIEVTKGGFDVLNQGSLGGSVNIVRKRPRLRPPHHAVAPDRLVRVLQPVGGRLVGQRPDGVSGRLLLPALPALTRTARGRTDDRTRRTIAPSLPTTMLSASRPGGRTCASRPAATSPASCPIRASRATTFSIPYLQMDAPYDNADRLGANYEFRELGAAVSASACSPTTPACATG